MKIKTTKPYPFNWLYEPINEYSTGIVPLFAPTYIRKVRIAQETKLLMANNPNTER